MSLRNTLFVSALVTVVMLSGCRKTWEEVPLEQFTEEYVWDKNDSLGTKARGFLADIYRDLPSGFNRVSADLLDAASDDAITSATGTTDIQKLATAGFTSLTNPEDVWNIAYTIIRKSTLFINNFEKVPLNIKLADGRSAKPAWRGEARFLRAFAYFMLLKRYGGIPLMGDLVRQVNDDVSIPRASFEETVNYIATECKLAADSLHLDPIEDGRWGYASKGAALALRARLLLYAASPLYNGGNIEAGNTLTGYTAFNAERWKLAADAANDIITYGKFSLESEFKKIFTLANSHEIIFARVGGPNTEVEKNNGPIGYAAAVSVGRTSPTQDLVDAFPMDNGLPITDPAAGYDPNFPYANRDPRLTFSIFYNGAQWLKRGVQTFEGGLDKPNTNVQQTRSGYYMRKFMGPFENESNIANTSHNFAHFRYGEVLLNYAEALNEYAGPVQEVYDAVEAIRRRAGLNPYQLAAGLTKEQLRTIIRTERRVELAFEEHRFFDIRRWKIAETVMNTPLHGMRIDISSSGVRSYRVIEISKPQFKAPAMYFYPIRYDEVAKNPNMQQNPGW